MQVRVRVRVRIRVRIATVAHMSDHKKTYLRYILASNPLEIGHHNLPHGT